LCKREVILAAGAIHSPTLLQVSGIGPADVLESLDIPVEIDLPGVGANLQDHPSVAAWYNCECPSSSPYLRVTITQAQTEQVEPLDTNSSLFDNAALSSGYDDAMAQYLKNRTGRTLLTYTFCV